MTKRIFINMKRWLSGCLLVFIATCNEAPAYNNAATSLKDSLQEVSRRSNAWRLIAQSKPLIRNGDIITRTGNDFTSESLRQFSQTDKTYSHCGIASIEHDSIFVYHALGGEFNPDQKLLRETLEQFCNPGGNRGFGIFQFKMTNENFARLDSVVNSWYNKGLMFDMDFKLETDDRLYCAEFVCKAITKATIGMISFKPSTIKEFNYYAVDNIILNQHCVEKKRYRF